MKFSEMPYTRPDVVQVGNKIEQAIAALRAAQTFEQADAVLHDVDELSCNVSTLASLAQIRHLIDTTDAFYDAESQFLDEQMPVVQESWQKWNLALFESPFRPEFEKKYGGLLFKNIEIALKAFSPEIIPELQRENALVTEYQNLIASAQIPFEGGVYTVSQLAPFKTDADDTRRRAAWEAEGRFYMENAEKLDGLYAELTELRTAMGKKLGFENYTGLGYCRMNRNSYDKEDVARFREAVVQHLVPVAERLQKQKAERMGFAYPMSYSDNALMFRDGNPRPCGTADDIMATGREFYHWLSPEAAEFIDFMTENELFDVLSKKGKAGGGFCSALPDYKAPFIFANFNGTQGDVDVITHEAGHAFADYMARNIFPSDCRNPTLESCEIHSMSMEFFAWPYAGKFFGADEAKYLYSHLASAITFIPYGTMVDHFQHIVYEKPEMTPAERHEVWRELTAVYMPWIKLDSLPFYGEGRAWQRQLHIYTDPFYYIDYCLAQTVALQFWAAAQADRADAWERYMKLVRLGGSKTFSELVAAADMETPFGDEALRTVAQAAEQWLSANQP